MSTEENPAVTNEISKGDRVVIHLHWLFQQFNVKINQIGSWFQHDKKIHFKAFDYSYEQCEMLEDIVLEIRKYVEAMVFSEDVGDITTPKWAFDRLPKYLEGTFGVPVNKNYNHVVRLCGSIAWHAKSMLIHECFREMQDDATSGWPESERIKDRSISDPVEFFYGYLQEIDASIAAVKLGIKRAEIRERELAHAHNERVITKWKEEDLTKLQAIVAREQRDFGNFPKANPK